MNTKAILVPFALPDYPEERINHFLSESQQALEDLCIEIKTTKLVSSIDDAQGIARQWNVSDFDFVVALVLSWLEPPVVITALSDWFHKPILLWSHTFYQGEGTILTLGPLPAAGVIRETLEEMGATFKFVWGMPKERKVAIQIDRFAKAARTVHMLSKARIGLFGYQALGMYTGGLDQTRTRKLLGPEIVHLGQYLIIEKAEKIDDELTESLVGEAKAKWTLSKDIQDSNLAAAMKFYLALKQLIDEHKLDALTVKCQYELSRHYLNAPCIPLSMLADSMPTSCEGDLPLLISQLILYHLTDGLVTSYGDVHGELDNGIIFAACGFAPLSFAREDRPLIAEQSGYIYAGLTNISPYKDGRVTLARLAQDGEGHKMHIAAGTSELSPPFHEVHCPSFAGTKIALDNCAHSFIEHLMSQHYALVYGEVSQELQEFCNLMGIRVILD